ncbi:MAG: hypothetical protein KBG78_05745 [Dermatophilaceae bacterium]|nr:hypothetical protein [Comamonadaceae bacterium]MBP8838309.1 hypothetical protein [Dermatophilaceae bacterium]
MVNLGADIAAALPQLRRQAESMMRDECTITRAGTQTWDDAAGVYTGGTPTLLYAGPCRVRRPNVAEREAAAGEADWTLTGAVVSIPVDGTTDDLLGATVTVVGCEMDPSLTGRVFTVLAPHAQSQATARRLRCVEVARA